MTRVIFRAYTCCGPRRGRFNDPPVLERRRIFKGRRTRPRIRGAALLLSAAVATPLILAVALPSNLFGSAPSDRQWQAETRDIRIVDGETLGLGDRVVRLAGIAAPTRGEACRGRTGETYDCGGAAAAALTRLVTGRPVICRIVGRDGFGRGLGECEASGTDLGRTLVGSGYAVATAAPLRSAEDTARAGAQGLWAHPAGAPASWRNRD